MNYVVQTRARNFIHEQGMRVSADALQALDKLVEVTLAMAMRAAQEQGRKTVRAEEILLGGLLAAAGATGAEIIEGEELVGQQEV